MVEKMDWRSQGVFADKETLHNAGRLLLSLIQLPGIFSVLSTTLGDWNRWFGLAIWS